MKLTTIIMLFWSATVFCADYEIVEQSVAITVQSNAFATERHREVVRILTENGTGYQKLLPVNSYIQVRNISGSVNFPNGKKEKITEEDIMELPISESSEMMSDLKAVAVSPSWLTKGSTFTVEYDRAITSLLYLSSCLYASDVPIKKSSCTITYPSTVPIKYRGQDEFVKIQKSTTGDKTVLQFDSLDRKEISLYGRSDSDVTKSVDLLPEKCMTDKWTLSTISWESVATWFTDLSKHSYQWDPAMDRVVDDAKAKSKSTDDLADSLYQYVQKNFAYTAIEIGIGGFKPRFTNQTFQKKYGDCKDLTFLYISLLKKAGIEGYPALVDTRNNRFFYKDFPSPGQFNHCIAYLPAIRNGIFVDSTVKNFRLGEVPVVIQGKEALVVGPNKLIEIPRDFMNSNVTKLSLTGTYGAQEVKYQGRMETSGLTTMLVETMKNALMKNLVKHYVYTTMISTGMPVQKMETKVENDRALSIGYSTPVYHANAYQMLLLNAINYSPLEALAYDPQPDQYFSLGNPERFVTDCSVDLSGHKLITAPFKKTQTGKFITYTLELKEDGGKLRYLADTYFANGLLDPVEMKAYQQELRQFSQQLQRVAVVQ
jgi:transglutaminase-like putative cysteine protease